MHVLEFPELELRGGFFVTADLFTRSRGGSRGVCLRHVDDVNGVVGKGGHLGS